MSEKTNFDPLIYVMSAELKSFFAKVSRDPDMQKKLYFTKEISDVEDIANNLGFKVTSAEILKAQAGRVLAIYKEDSADFEELISGRRAKRGAQWGRDGKGYLDRAGFWLLELESSKALSSFEKKLKSFLSKVKLDLSLKNKLLESRSYNDVSSLANELGFNLSGVSLLLHQAKTILSLSYTDAKKVASGADSKVS
jgi:predicted ribosomally synthesized peptide with nif11-like leader